MKSVAARDAKRLFGRLIDDARLEPVIVEKHGRPLVVVLSFEAYSDLARKKHISASKTNQKDI